jgi:D-sedoheptulose 7-phosphate isomerase
MVETATLSALELTRKQLSALIRCMNFVEQFVSESVEVLRKLSCKSVDQVVDVLVRAREQGGRAFVLGVGGSAAAASHCVNDLRKLAAMEAYAPTDNVSELTARINDEGWVGCLAEWLKGSRLRKGDVLLVFSVGGGDAERNISPNLVEALKLAKKVGAFVVGIVGRDGGYTAQVADACVIIPVVNPDHITPHTEAFHMVVHHMIITHPSLKAAPTKWESEIKR